MPTSARKGERVLRLTIIFDPPLYDEVVHFARETHLSLAPAARMLIVEALATRAAFPSMLSSAERQRRLRQARNNQVTESATAPARPETSHRRRRRR